MKMKTKILSSTVKTAMLLLAATAPSAGFAGEGEKTYSPYANRDFPENVFWGDTHLHTNLSADAYSFGDRFTPDVAYRFARGETITTQGEQPVRLGRPLDFLVISDHAQFLGYLPLLEKNDPGFLATPLGKRLASLSPKERIQQIAVGFGNFVSFPEAEYEKLPREEDPALRRTIWKSVAEEADRYNQPGRFTAFIGYEWTSMPDVANLHRVVMFSDDAGKASQVMPFSVSESRDPEALWAYLQDYENKTGGSAMAIPHNGNLSWGRMFDQTDYNGEPLTKEYAETRARWEPITEVTQVKGDGETHPLLSPDDLFADYETWSSISSEGAEDLQAAAGSVQMVADSSAAQLEGDYARSALRRGLKLEQQLGINPFKFGMIGSSDIHTSLSTVEENNFYSKMPFEDPSPDRSDLKKHLFPTKDYAASGMAAVWAEENTRESLFEAMKRRETYATTGPRITLRFFGGWDFDNLDANRPDYAAIGYKNGVPMGGDLTRAPKGEAPRFMIVAAKDPMGANLERIQVVKGWLDGNGETREKVYDVVLSDGRKPKAQMAPSIDSTVDIKTATYTNSVGEAEMATVWRDPDFNPRERAFYYVRVLEIPTPRWTTYDAAFFGSELPEDVPAVHQERAYSSPIWYTP